MYKKGGRDGQTLHLPATVLHLTEGFFQVPESEAFLNHVGETAINKGNPCFVFDRGDESAWRIFGHPFPGPAADLTTPWLPRYICLHNVSVNLPRLAYRAQGDDRVLFQLLDDAVDLAAKAHVQKRDFMEKLLSYGDDGPLSLLAMNQDGRPYLRMGAGQLSCGNGRSQRVVQAHTGQASTSREIPWPSG